MKICRSKKKRGVCKVTKEELNQLQDLRREIDELDAKIAKLQHESGGRIVSDKVRASTKEFPYVQTSVKITGLDYEGDQRSRKRIERKRQLLMERKERAEELELRITQYINTVGDSRIRRMMEYKYVEGYTWEEIGRVLHCDRTAAEKAVARYLKENVEGK